MLDAEQLDLDGPLLGGIPLGLMKLESIWLGVGE